MLKRTSRRPRSRHLNRCRLGIEQLESRDLPSSIMDLGNLRFFTSGNDLGTGLVQMGLVPSSDNVFTPLVQFQNGVTFNTGAGTFSNHAGDVTTIGSSPKTLMSGSFTFAASDVTGPGVNISNGAALFSLAHVSFKINHLQVYDPTGGSTADSQLRLNGALSLDPLPGLSVPVSGTNFVVEDGTGHLGLGVGPFTFTGSFTFVGATFATAPSLSVTFVQTPTVDQFQITGGVSVTIGSSSLTMTTTGYGLTVENGEVSTLEATFTGKLKVGGADLPSESLNVAYRRPSGGGPGGPIPAGISLTGSTKLHLASQSLDINLTDPGLVIANRQVQDLNGSFTGNLGVAGAGLKLDDLTVVYTAASGGSADYLNITTGTQPTTFTIGSQKLSISLPAPGLKIANGQVQDLNGSFTGNLGVAGAGLKLDGLTVSYTSANDTLNIFNQAGSQPTTFTVGSQTLSVYLPGTGLVIQDNKLRGLRAGFTGHLGLAGAQLKLDQLTGNYVPASDGTSDSLQLTGSAGLAVGSDSLTVTMLGNGIVIQGGSLQQASATIKANFTLFSLGITPDLTFAYNKDDETCELWGSLTVIVGGATISAAVDQSQPLLIRNGTWDLQSLEFDLNGHFDLFGLTVNADNLTLIYNQQASGGSQYKISGGISIPDLFGAFAQIGKGGQPGIVITNGHWDIENLTVRLSDVHLGAFTLKKFQFSIVNNSFGRVDADVSLPCGLDIDGDIQFEDHHIQEVALSANHLKVPIGDTGLFLTGIGAKVDNIYAGDLTVSGNISVALGEPVTIAGHTAAIVTATGSFRVNSSELDLTAEVDVLGGYIAQGTGHIVLNWGMGDYRADVSLSVYDGIFTLTGGMDFNSAHVFTVWGEADLRVPKNIPIIGGKTLAGIDFAGKYDPHGDQFVAAWTEISIAGHDIWAGVEYDFQKDKLELIGHKSIEAIQSKIHPDPQHYYQSNSFTFPGTATGGSFEETWKSDLSSPPIYFRAPAWGGAAQINTSSTTQTLTDPSKRSPQSYTITLVQDRMTPTSAAFLVKPSGSSAQYPLMPSGDYVISVQVPSSGQVNEVTITGHYTQPTPTIALSESAASLNNYTLAATFQTATPNSSSIALYYDYDLAGFSGTRIPTSGPLPNPGSYFAPTTTTYSWNVSDLPPTPLYLYALINDGVNPPQLSPYVIPPIIPQPPLAVEMDLVDAPASDLEGWQAVVTDVSGNVLQRSTNPKGQQGFDLPTGSYTVTVRGHFPAYVALPGAGQVVTADGGLAQTITITDPTHQSVVTRFSFRKQAEISGRVFEDFEATGTYDLADPPLCGWTVYEDANGNGLYDIGETCSVTDETGRYRLYFNPPDVGKTNNYIVRQVLPSSWWRPEEPASGTYHVALTQQAGQPAPFSGGNDFLNVQLVSLSGVVFDDANRNGRQDAGEPGLPNFTVRVTEAGGALAATATTDANGSYAVTTKLAVNQTYNVVPINLPAGASVTYPISKVFQFGAPLNVSPDYWETNAPSNYFYDLVTGDFDGDKKPDFISLGRFSVGATISVPYAYSILQDNYTYCTPRNQSYFATDANKCGTQLTAGDLNHDGKDELVITGYDGTFHVWRYTANADGTWGRHEIYVSSALATGHQARVSLVDLNGDSFWDLLANDGYGWINDKTGQFARTPQQVLPMPSLATGTVFADVIAFDYDADGNPNDLAMAYVKADGQATLSVYLQSQAGVPSYFHAQDIALPGQSVQRLAVADFDQNGYSDLAVATSEGSGTSLTNHIVLLANDGRILGQDQDFVFVQKSVTGKLLAGDVDGNGHPDILWSVQGEVGALLNQGRDYFTPSRNNQYNSRGFPEPSFYIPRIGLAPGVRGTLPGIVVVYLEQTSGQRNPNYAYAIFQSSAQATDAYVVQLATSGVQPGYNFGIAGLAPPTGPSIGGMVYNDFHNNGTQDLREGGLANVTVQLLLKSTALPVATTTTDQWGMYRFDGVAAGEYLVQLAGLSLTTTTPSTPYDVVLSGNMALGGLNYGVHLPGSEGAGIQGTIYDDVNRNGAWDTALGTTGAEKGIPSVLVYLDLNSNGQLDAGEPSQRTTALGTYCFTGFRPGSYEVRYLTPQGYVPTGATSVQKKLGVGETGYGADLGVAEETPVAGFGNAVTLNGTSSYIEVAASLNNRSNWTFSVWVKPTASGDLMIYSEGNPYVTLAIDVTAQQQIHVGVWRSDVAPNWVHFYTPANVVQLNQWNFVAVTVARGGMGSGEVTVYVNGLAYSGSLQAEFHPKTTYAAIGRNIGSLHGGNQPISAFAGTIDEVRMWSVARSMADIQGDYMRTIPADARDLLAYWRLDDGSGPTASNHLGYNPGTLNNGAAWTASTVPVSYALIHGSSVSGVLFGSTAPGGSLTYQIVNKPAHGSVTLNAQTGQFTYAPTTGWSGTDSFTFEVVNSQGVVSANTYPVALTVRPAAVAFSIAEYDVSRSAGNAVLAVVRTGSIDSAATVQYCTTDGSGLAGIDYVATSGTLTLPAGARSGSFIIPLLSWQGPGDRSLLVSLSWPSAGLGLASPSTATLVITTPLVAEGIPANLQTLANQITHSQESFAYFVKRAYELYLMRPADQDGLAYWVGRMQSGLTQEQMEANFLSSLEYVQNHGGGPGQAWVEGMYRDLLGREADAAGRDNWLAQLAAGTDPIQVAYGIAASREREALRVRDNYWIYLGRAATDGEVNFWVDRFILDGARNEDVVGGFVGSAEFFNNLGRGQGNRTAWVQSAYRHLLHRSVAADEVAQWLRAMN